MNRTINSPGIPSERKTFELEKASVAADNLRDEFLELERDRAVAAAAIEPSVSPSTPFRESLNRNVSTVLMNGIWLDNEPLLARDIESEMQALAVELGFTVKTEGVVGKSDDMERWVEDQFVARNDGTLLLTLDNDKEDIEGLRAQGIEATVPAINRHALSPGQSYILKGGNLLTVEGPDGQDSYLIGNLEIDNVLAERLGRRRAPGEAPSRKDEESIKKLICEALAIPQERTIFVPQAREGVQGLYHLDCFMIGLGRGEVAMNDPRLAVEVLEKIFASDSLTELQRWRAGKMLDSMKGDLDRLIPVYERARAELEANGFVVKPVPGIFYSNEGASWGGGGGLTREDRIGLTRIFKDTPVPDPVIEERLQRMAATHPERANTERARTLHEMGATDAQVNFMNGIVGRNGEGTGWLITNGSQLFPQLNSTFQNAIGDASGGEVEKVRFVTHSYLQLLGGIQCLTVELPKKQ